jgi:hypothetical protein
VSNTSKIRNNFFKLVLIIIAAGAPVYITSSYKANTSAKIIGFQKSINRVPQKRKPLSPEDMKKMHRELSVY